MEFRDKSILILGAGISGISAANVLSKLGAVVTLSDAKAPDAFRPEILGQISPAVIQCFGSQSIDLLNEIDFIILSPGISIYHPLVASAADRGILVMSEIEVAYHLCQAPIIAVTGTNGKTTTTSLIGEMVKTMGRKTIVGGNIGVALSQEVTAVEADGVVVAEISSFQLEAIHDFRARIAAVLNLTPDHIDRHRNFETYQFMKERIFQNQKSEDCTVLNYDDQLVRKMSERVPGKILFFSRKMTLDEGVFVSEGYIKIKWQGNSVTICPVADLKLPGAHNLENSLAACGVSFLAGVQPENMARVLREFKGVEHRIELVTTINGVSYYNDSKATNPESAVKALESFHDHIILIAGGRDKNTDLSEFMSLVKQRVDHLILIGEAAERFSQEAHKHGVTNIHMADSMAMAVKLAGRMAAAPQVVLLSPACASYDMFKNYEERGRIFKNLVYGLIAD